MDSVVPSGPPAFDTHEPGVTYGSDGVDLTLIRWMLSLTPRERVEILQQHMDSLAALRERAQIR